MNLTERVAKFRDLLEGKDFSEVEEAALKVVTDLVGKQKIVRLSDVTRALGKVAVEDVAATANALGNLQRAGRLTFNLKTGYVISKGA